MSEASSLHDWGSVIGIAMLMVGGFFLTRIFSELYRKFEERFPGRLEVLSIDERSLSAALFPWYRLAGISDGLTAEETTFLRSFRRSYVVLQGIVIIGFAICSWALLSSNGDAILFSLAKKLIHI